MVLHVQDQHAGAELHIWAYHISALIRKHSCQRMYAFTAACFSPLAALQGQAPQAAVLKCSGSKSGLVTFTASCAGSALWSQPRGKRTKNSAVSSRKGVACHLAAKDTLALLPVAPDLQSKSRKSSKVMKQLERIHEGCFDPPA